ncbi:ABC transporter substrate-binding protein [Ferrovibrio terrae]|uniref:ABC transporter substrate-binding protein n=1 Tax=Ferrovibrio terrae TaxID=2594003 RepID=A0A516H5Z5_9PROT|nr:ABC transporter substrate-binding protein [Ferrovibrio terrae]QDO99214.1 ABC transporter substrate-binding protein [Ferrovibrio terrae]
MMTRLSRRRLLATAFAAAATLPHAAFANTPRRIVVAGGALTEIVVALGAGDQLVGVDQTSLHPATVRSLPQIGYLRTLGAEGILSLSPDLIILSDQAGPPTTMAQLRGTKVPMLVVPESYIEPAVPKKILAIADAVGRQPEGKALAATVEADLQAVQRMVAPLRRPRVLFVLSTSNGAVLAGGRETASDAMLRLAGAQNVVTDYKSFKPLNAEAALAADPDAILLPDHSFEALGGKDGITKLPALAQTTAGRAGRIYTMDTLYMLGLGPRIAHAARDLAAILHPGSTLPALPARAWL